jgi:tetratricopeptide (TPR) repeat protein
VGADLVNTALNFDPGFVEAWNTLGTILDRQGDAERAQNAYLHALSLDPNLDYVHSNLCFSYLQSGMVSEAISHGERAKQLNPAMLVAHNNLGWAYGMLGELDRAIEEFSQSGGEAVARNNLGLILLKRGQIAESLEQFRMAARMRPYYKDAVSNYKMARDLSFQRRREAKNPAVEQTGASATFGFARIADAGLGLLSEDLHLLAGQPAAPLPEKPTVTVETKRVLH